MPYSSHICTHIIAFLSIYGLRWWSTKISATNWSQIKSFWRISIYCLDFSCRLPLSKACRYKVQTQDAMSEWPLGWTQLRWWCAEKWRWMAPHIRCVSIPSAEERRYPHLVSLSPSELQPNSNDDWFLVLAAPSPRIVLLILAPVPADGS